MKNGNKELGQLLKKHRKEAFGEDGLRRVAISIGLDYAYLFRVEAGDHVPKDDNLVKMLDAYKVKDPLERLEAFRIARTTEQYQKALNKAFDKEGAKKVADVLYRSKRNKK